MKKCLNSKCKKSFEPNSKKQVYCSTACRMAAMRAKSGNKAKAKKKAHPFDALCASLGVKGATAIALVKETYSNKAVKAPIASKKPLTLEKQFMKDVLEEVKKEPPKSGGYDRRKSKLGF